MYNYNNNNEYNYNNIKYNYSNIKNNYYISNGL